MIMGRDDALAVMGGHLNAPHAPICLASPHPPTLHVPFMARAASLSPGVGADALGAALDHAHELALARREARPQRVAHAALVRRGRHFQLACQEGCHAADQSTC